MGEPTASNSCVSKKSGGKMAIRGDVLATGLLLAVTLLIGGAGVNYPMLQMILGLVAIGVAGYYALRPAPFTVELGRPALLLLGACFALPLLQLIPLPPILWHALPGRSGARELDALLGWTMWRPLTLDVEGTIRAILVLIPGAVAFIGFLRLSPPDRLKMLYLIPAFALLSGLLGIIQAASGGGFTPFASGHAGYPIGLFVNRNHQAVAMLGAMPVTAALAALRIRSGRAPGMTIAIALSALAIFAVVVLATTSRMGLVLLAPTLLAALAIMFVGQSLGRRTLPALLIVAALFITIWLAGGLARTFQRFAGLSDIRLDYWTDVKWALGHYGLAGTGIGTFVPVHKSAESLETVSTSLLNHAHNDYIELLLEGGIPAAILIAAFFCLLGAAIWRRQRDAAAGKTQLLAIAALVGIVDVLLFSLVDYPLRMPAISVAFALLVVVVLPDRESATALVKSSRRGAKVRQHPAILGASFAGLAAIAMVVVQAGVSNRLLIANAPDYAAQWAPWSTEARERQATAALLNDWDSGKAAIAAAAALRRSPINAPAIRTVGILAGLSGYDASSAKLLQMAAVLGWRDAITNLWALEGALNTGDATKAAQRAEALFRQNALVGQATGMLLRSPNAAPAVALLIQQLRQKPDWRRSFLRSADQLPADAVPRFQLLIMALNRTDAPATFDEAQPLMERLRESGQRGAQRALWRSLFRDSFVANGGFENTETTLGPELPKDWQIGTDDLSTLSIDHPGARGSATALRSVNSRIGVPLLAQYLLLDPGDYKLTFSARGTGGTVRWELRCDQSGQEQHGDFPLATDSQWRSMTAVLPVPNQNCASQRLSFQLLGDNQNATVWLDNVALSQRRLTRQ